ATDTDAPNAVPHELQEDPQQEKHLRPAAFLPWQERSERSYARMQGYGVSMEGQPSLVSCTADCAMRHQCVSPCVLVCAAFLEALNAAHYPLALYPSQQVITDSFSQAFFDYLRAIDLQVQHPVTVPYVRSSQLRRLHASAARQKRCVYHKMAMCIVLINAFNKPSSYAGVATRDLEQHTDTYLDRSGPEGAVQQLHGSGQLNLVAKQFVYYLLAVALLVRQCCGVLHMLHLYIGFACHFQQATPLRPQHSTRHYGRELHQLLSDRDRCIEQQALLHMEQGRLLVWLRHMIVVCKGACSGPEAHALATTMGGKRLQKLNASPKAGFKCCPSGLIAQTKKAQNDAMVLRAQVEQLHQQLSDAVANYQLLQADMEQLQAAQREVQGENESLVNSASVNMGEFTGVIARISQLLREEGQVGVTRAQPCYSHGIHNTLLKEGQMLAPPIASPQGPIASPDLRHMYQLALAAIATQGQAAPAQGSELGAAAPAPGFTLRKRTTPSEGLPKTAAKRKR
ncbi:hypothetical protein QJQ45_028411, partial [Haematococcus lacustris]